ncbi:uncharacterized protein LOC122391007 [Amphibalanus amphitrite]|uniref:uncharacterized protein LOC122391007 n=1 Tax=Amphibalanus amphitrite TaxID=1232801 RepID=UPI001C8FCC52|nr:uncharacterized protein LOC122391007 [Amphibalanus amphitrite]
MSCRYKGKKSPNDFARLHQKLARIEKDLQDAASNVTRADPRDEEMSVDTMLREKRSMEERLDQMQSELERLECYAADGTSDYGREPFRTSSPGELAKPRSRPAKRSRVAPPRRRSADTCRCRCNSFFSSTRSQPAFESDRQLQQLQQDLAEATGQKQTMQERIYELEETQKQNENDQEEIRSMLEQERERMEQMEQENGDLRETIQRLELDLSNLPVGDCGMMREASVQITQLLQTLNEDMVKAPELCTRLRMAAQQIIDVEKRCANERGARSMDQQEVQFLRNENQRLREVAFRANLSAFQATVSVPQAQMMGMPMYGMPGQMQPGMAPGMGMGMGIGAAPSYIDPYAGGFGSQSMGATQQPRKSVFQRVFGKKESVDPGPATLQFQDGSTVQFDPAMTMQQQRLSMALQEPTEDGTKRLAMLNQDKRRGCCPR